MRFLGWPRKSNLERLGDVLLEGSRTMTADEYRVLIRQTGGWLEIKGRNYALISTQDGDAFKVSAVLNVAH